MKKKRIVLAGVAAFILIAAVALAVTATDRWLGGSGAPGVDGPNAALWREYLAQPEEHLTAQRGEFPPPPRPLLSPDKRAARDARVRAKAEKVVREVMVKKGVGEREALEFLVRKERRVIDEFRMDTAAREAVRDHEQEKHPRSEAGRNRGDW